MKQIMQRIFDKKEEPSINDLRTEKNSLKKEFREVKSTLKKIEIDVYQNNFLTTLMSLLKKKRLLLLMKILLINKPLPRLMVLMMHVLI